MVTFYEKKTSNEHEDLLEGSFYIFSPTPL